ncbi:MAG TPA: hypothetical protein VNZ53_19325 [Steroidobacteraceae bacterium]|nr:hypothetical protein [Steroidobacteraceae bacterium]
MTTTVTVKNNGPSLITVRSHYLDDEHRQTGSYHGQDIAPDKEHTFVLNRGVQLTVDELIIGKRTV